MTPNRSSARACSSTPTAESAVSTQGSSLEIAHLCRSEQGDGGEPAVPGEGQQAALDAVAGSPAANALVYAPQGLWVLLDLVEAAMRTGRQDLYEIFPKLGVTSRAALRDALPRSENLP